jgi:hypothetical protein
VRRAASRMENLPRLPVRSLARRGLPALRPTCLPQDGGATRPGPPSACCSTSPVDLTPDGALVAGSRSVANRADHRGSALPTAPGTPRAPFRKLVGSGVGLVDHRLRDKPPSVPLRDRGSAERAAEPKHSATPGAVPPRLCATDFGALARHAPVTHGKAAGMKNLVDLAPIGLANRALGRDRPAVRIDLGAVTLSVGNGGTSCPSQVRGRQHGDRAGRPVPIGTGARFCQHPVTDGQLRPVSTDTRCVAATGCEMCGISRHARPTRRFSWVTRATRHSAKESR